jgi:peptide/nickel transport system substrate-binding protein/oligopeptide transport system substrate-binding protein
MYQDGKLDSTGIPPDRLDEAKQRTNEYVQAPLLQIVYIATNFLAKPFDDLRIRQAFALAIQRDRIRYDVYKDTIIPTYHIIPQGMQGYSGSKLVGPFNVQDTNGNASVAQRLFQQGLREEGWSTVSQMPPIKFTYYSGDPATDKVITLLIQMWQSVLGVNVTPDPVDFNKELAEIQTTINNPSGLQMWYLAWISDYPDPQDWISINFDKGAAQNAMNYGQSNTADANQEQIVQSEMERADAELDPTTRIQLYQDAEQQLVNQVAWIPLFQSTRRALVKPYIQGLVFNPLRVTPPTDWANIYIAQH